MGFQTVAYRMAVPLHRKATLSAIEIVTLFYHSFYNSFPKNNPRRVIILLILFHYTNVAPIILGADDKFKLVGNEKA